MRTLLRRLSASTLFLAVGGCSATDILNRTALGTGVGVTTDIAYGDGERRTLDVYAPAGAHSAPVVVFFYGGGWTSGSKADYRFVGLALAARGFVTIVPDYRLYPEVRYPAFIEDGAAAVRWARDHAVAQGGDPGRIVLVGHSAGAYIAAMLALDDRWLGANDMVPGRDLAGVVGLAGPYDFLPLNTEELKAIFAPAADLGSTQPITHVGPGAPPMLLITGDGDDTVKPGNTMRLAAKLAAAGDQATTIVYPGVSHRILVGAFAWPLRPLAPTLDDVARFVAASKPR